MSTETTEVTEKKSVGRPLKYSGDVLNHIIELYQKIGTVLKTREILIAPNDNSLSDLRDKNIIPNPLTISMPCLSNILSRAGVQKSGPGRPKVEKKPENITTVVVETKEEVIEPSETDAA